MSVLNENTIIGASGASSGFEIDHSLRLHNRGGDGASTGKTLRRTPSVNSNRRTWTLSMWHKRGDITFVQLQDLFVGVGAGGGGDGVVRLRFERGAYAAKDKLWFSLDGPTPGVNAITNRLFRDPSAWMHIVIRFDTTQSTVTDRARIYINGEVIPSTEYSHLWTSAWSNLAQNSEWAVNKAGWYESFAGNGSTSNPDNVLGGYLADIAFVDGQSLGPDSFGETGDYGEWKPIDVSGLTFGTNGYHLDFADSSAMGNDANGSNNFSVYNITANDQMLDSPTNNFCTMNPLRDLATVVYSNGNCWSALPAGDNTNGATGTFAPSSGKWYWEATSTHTPTSFGIASSDAAQSALHYSAVGMTNYYLHTGIKWVSGSNSSYGASGSAGDIIGTALDMDNRTIQFFKNGSSLGAAFTIAAGTSMAPACFGANASNVKTVRWNFGADSSFAATKTAQGNADSGGIGDFYYAPPTGFLALCSANLPSVDVIPSEHFNTVLYTGNGSTQSITGVGFQPDFTWLKPRSIADNNVLLDSVRGVNQTLYSNTTGAESDRTGTNDSLTAFDSDGFSIGNWNNINTSAATHAAWNWKAGGTAVSNTNGSITSSVSANPSAGFSIVSYTGTGSAGTIGHGLSKSPEMIIVKNRNATYNWFVYHKSNTAAPETDFLNLDQTDATQDLNTIWNDTLPTASVFSVGTHIVVNANTNGFISYAFHSVDGYSKVGSFVGNGSETAGPFVHCGFKPKFVLVKRATAVGSWFMFDTDRSPYNVMNAKLSAENSGAEDSDTSWNIDFLSNGFKLRSPHVYMNSGSNTHVFLAFAETPFKYSNAR
jgi:hypothetical protein